MDVMHVVAPTDSTAEHNTIRRPLTAIDAWELGDHHFAFDSSVLLPSMSEDLLVLIEKIRAHPGSPLAIFGHADPVGHVDYNKTLSGRRASALYALLTRRVALWEQLSATPVGGDHWTRDDMAASIMEGHLASRQDSASPTAPAGPLYARYIAALGVDATGAPFSVPPEAFLGKGADAHGKADYQGCGEANPLVMFSRADTLRYQQPEHRLARNDANALNRRVTVLFFEPGTVYATDRWPCPRAGEGVAGCRKRYWSDAALRAQHLASERRYPDARDTFQCRFYDRLLDVVGTRRRQLRCQLHDPRLQPIGRTKVIVRHGDAAIETMSDSKGWIVVTLPQHVINVRVEYVAPSDGIRYHVPVSLPALLPTAEERYLAQMVGLGFGDPGEPLRVVILRFQGAHPELTLTGRLDDQTRARLDRLRDTALTSELGTADE